MPPGPVTRPRHITDGVRGSERPARQLNAPALARSGHGQLRKRSRADSKPILEKARARYDRNHRGLAVEDYELPFGQGKKFASRSGWKSGRELSWLQPVESGNPINFSWANSPYNYFPTFAVARRPDVVSEPTFHMGKWDKGGPDRFTPQQNRPAVVDLERFRMGPAVAATRPPPSLPPTSESAMRVAIS